MALPCKPMPERPDLQELLRKAVEAFNSLTPEQQIAHRREQRKSWVIGEMMLEHPEMTREEAEQIFLSVERGQIGPR